MDRLRRSLRSFRRRSDGGTLSERHHGSGAGGSHPSGGDDGSKPPVWSQDEASVRAGTCSFKVKYLGSVEVYESRGMQVCEEALKVLRNSRRKPIKGILYISGDSLRVVDKDSKGLAVDQTIEKVSFCAPDRQHEKGFAYICRDGTTRRWLCYGFHARKNTGERLSHAVGCAFAVCLEKKQKRDREVQRSTSTQGAGQLQSIAETGGESARAPVPSSSSTSASSNVVEKGYSNTASAFQRNSYRYASLQERLQDPQNVKPAERPPVKPATNPHAVARPRGNKELFERQGSLRLPNEQSPPTAAAPAVVPPIKNGAPDDPRFRRFNSLRLNQLPSNLARYEQSSNAFDQGAIVEEDSSPNTPIANSKSDTGRLSNTAAAAAYGSPSISELSSPSSGTWTSSTFEASKSNSINETVASSQQYFNRNNPVNRSRGDEWLQTTASQVKFWQQVRGVSPPTASTTTTTAMSNDRPKLSSPSASVSPTTTMANAQLDRHQPPPSFPPPPLPTTVALNVKTNTVVVMDKNGAPSSTDSQKQRNTANNNWTTFEDKWSSLESPNPNSPSPHPSAAAPLSPTNPFSQESSAVKI